MRARSVPVQAISPESPGDCADVAAVLLECDLPRLRFLLENGCKANSWLENSHPLDCPSDVGQRTPLLVIAAVAGNIDAVRLLLSFGAEVDARSYHEEDCFFSRTSFLRSGGSALTFAAKRGFVEMVDLLLLRGADPNIGDICRRTPLSLASGEGHHAVVRRLLQEKVKVDATDCDTHDALHYAARCGFVEIVQLLKKAGARGKTPIDWQTALYQYSRAGDLEGVKEALRQGASLQGREQLFSETSLHLACRHGRSRIVSFLLDLGAEVDAGNEWLETPLVLALKNQDLEVVRLLLEHRPKINIQTKFQETPLQMAVKSAKPRLVTMILGCGMPFSLRDFDDARKLANATGDAEMIKVFETCFGRKPRLALPFQPKKQEG